MKYIVLSDDVGQAIYFDHPSGQMICPLLATSQEVFKENFNEYFKSVRCSDGDGTIVFEQFGYISLLIYSDEHESESYLRWQLLVVKDLMTMIFGPRISVEKRIVNFNRQKKRLQRVFDTLSTLCQAKQSFLVNSVERLDLSHEIRAIAVNAVKSNLRREGFPAITQVLLLVGTKVLISYAKTRHPELGASDILLLSVMACAHFRPKVRELKVDALPIADYRDHKAHQQQPDAPPEREEAAISAEEDEFHSADEDFWDAEESMFETDEEGAAKRTRRRVRSDDKRDKSRELIERLEKLPTAPHSGGGSRKLVSSDGNLPSKTRSSGTKSNLSPQLSASHPLTHSKQKAHSNNDVATVIAETIVSSGDCSTPERDNDSQPASAASSFKNRTLSWSASSDSNASNSPMSMRETIEISDDEQLTAAYPEATPTIKWAEEQSFHKFPGSMSPQLLRVGGDHVEGEEEEKENSSDDENDHIEELYSSADFGELDLTAEGNGGVFLSRERSDESSSIRATTVVYRPDESAATEERLISRSSSLLENAMEPSLLGDGNRRNSLTATAECKPQEESQSFEEVVATAISNKISFEPKPSPKRVRNQRSALLRSGVIANDLTIEDDEEVETRAPLHQNLYLSLPNLTLSSVHFFELEKEVTLVAVTKGSVNSPNADKEKQQLSKICSGLRRDLASYMPFFLTRERTHLVPDMVSYMHKLPGLVHFIFVDRTAERVLAPGITSLEGPEYDGPVVASEHKYETLRHHVFDMVYRSHEALSLGFNYMLSTVGDFQYSYKIWFEDKEEGVELYTLYLAGVAASTIHSHNRLLVNALLQGY